MVTFSPFRVHVRLSVRALPVVGCEFGFRTPTVLPVKSVDPPNTAEMELKNS
jgi:hypothetical protein